jgi:hypothetical protein
MPLPTTLVAQGASFRLMFSDRRPNSIPDLTPRFEEVLHLWFVEVLRGKLVGIPNICTFNG